MAERRNQLRRLAEAADAPNITIQVLPKSSVRWEEMTTSGLPSRVPVLFAFVQNAPGPGFVVQRPMSPIGSIE